MSGTWTIALAAWAALATAASAAEAGGGFTGELKVTLFEALFRQDGPEPDRPNLVLHFEGAEGKWARVWGMALGYNNAVHAGIVEEGAVADGRIRLKPNLIIARDRWARGGRAAYTIDLKRTAGGAFAGTFAGTFQDRKTDGRATAELLPPRPIRVKDFRPVQPDEHPRVLFRRSELPGLRARLETPLGRAYLDKAREAKDLVSLGMLYRLTGERSWAEQAMAIIRAYRQEPGGIGASGWGSGGFGHRFVHVCLAYDLCFDAWPAGFRKQLEGDMFERIELFQRRLPTGHANYHPCSNYYGPGRGAPAIASLCLWGVKGPAPAPPPDPYAGRDPAAPIPPAGGARDAPVAKFVDGQMPPEWIYVGGFTVGEGGDALAALGGAAKARPVVGTKVAFGGRTEEFRPISREPNRGYWAGPGAAGGEVMIDITGAIGRVYHSTSYFYTVIDSDRERAVRLMTDYVPAEAYVSGVRLVDDDVALLGKGRHPVLVVAPIGEVPSWGRVLMRPRFVDLPAARAEALIADRRAAHRLAAAMAAADREAWRASGGVDPRAQRFVDIAHRQVVRHYRLGIGDGGFQAETGVYAMIASWYPLVYAEAYRRFFGRDASGQPDVTHLMPRRMMQVLFRADGTRAVEKINSVAGFDARWCAAALPIAPEAYQPALLWAWNHAAGVTDAPSTAKALQGDGLNLAQAFLHYPLQMKPLHPGKVMPLTWRAPTFGHYCFRSGWAGDDDFIAQVFCKASLIKGWNHGNAGTLRIFGLGHGWVVTPESRNGVRAQEPVVYLPDDDHNEGACGRVTHLATGADGSGAVTVDLSDVYAGARTCEVAPPPAATLPALPPAPKAGEAPPTGALSGLLRRIEPQAAERPEPGAAKPKPAPEAPAIQKPVSTVRTARLYDQNLIRLPDGFAETGISGLRALAFDYSGRCGAPCMMVLVDRIRGGGRKVWAWQVPKGASVKLAGSSFAIDYGDASMRATFVAPAGVTLRHADELIRVRDPRHGFHGRVNRITGVADGDFDGFFVVATFQRGPAPPVHVTGSGLAAEAAVGKRRVRFDGEKIIVRTAD